MKKVHFIVVGVCVLVLLPVPFDTELVPEWRLKVVGGNGTTLSNITVEESWEHYAYPESRFPTAKGYELKRSDENGVVVFPKRMLRASIGSRIVFPILARVGQLAHGSAGLDINARVFDEVNNYFSNSEDMIFWYSDQDGTKPLPNTIIATPS